MFESIQNSLQDYNGDWKNKKGIWEFSTVIAERKAFLSTKKLTYSARFKINEATKLITFSEMLMEAGFGMVSGNDFGDSMNAGFGFKAESYNTMSGAREGNIQERSDLFGKKFDYKFDYKEIRNKIEKLAKSNGYEFKYQILPIK